MAKCSVTPCLEQTVLTHANIAQEKLTEVQDQNRVIEALLYSTCITLVQMVK